MNYDYANLNEDESLLHLIRVENEESFELIRNNEDLKKKIIKEKGSGEIIFLYKDNSEYKLSSFTPKNSSFDTDSIDSLSWENDLNFS